MKRLSPKNKTKIIRLANKGLSLNKISKLTGKSKSTIYYHVKNFVKKVSCINLSLLNEWERGYLIGFFFGDGNLAFPKKEYSYRVIFNLNKKKEEEIAKRIEHILKKAGGKPFRVLFKNPRNKNLLRIVCVSKNLYEFCKNNIVYKIKKEFRGMKNVQKKSHLKKLNFSKKFICGFIGGIIDSDGYINLKKGYSATISSSSRKFINQLGFILEQMYIDFSIYKNKNLFVLRFKTYDYKMFQEKFNSIKGRWSNGRTH